MAALAAAGLTGIWPQRATAPGIYARGVHVARVAGYSSEMLLARKLSLPPATARALQARLIRTGILAPDRTTGIALTQAPYPAALRFGPRPKNFTL